MESQGVSIIGSTGSIGTQALQVARAFTNQIRIVALTANSQIELLTRQALEFRPELVVIANPDLYPQLKKNLSSTAIRVACGKEGMQEAASLEQAKIVLTATVGYAGLDSTLAAVASGKIIGLANKESLVVAGEQVTQLAQQTGAKIIPVDSEHSAIYQSCIGEPAEYIERIILTASGGPFRGFSLLQLEKVTPAQALKHPNWTMGAKITIDSASMMNKGLEIIEAKWLFDLQTPQISVIVHPQSIVHSFVEFKDGSLKAQIGLPDMRAPIQYALCNHKRPANPFPKFDFANAPNWTFETLDLQVFQGVSLAYQVLEMGGNAPCILNAANEIAVQAFLEEKIPFLKIYECVQFALSDITHLKNPTLEQLAETDVETRAKVRNFAK